MSMGMAIYYCARCAVQIRGSELLRAKAVRMEDRLLCARCRDLEAQTPPKSTAIVRSAPADGAE